MAILRDNVPMLEMSIPHTPSSLSLPDSARSVSKIGARALRKAQDDGDRLRAGLRRGCAGSERVVREESGWAAIMQIAKALLDTIDESVIRQQHSDAVLIVPGQLKRYQERGGRW